MATLHFSDDICSICVSVSHFGNFHNISKFLIIAVCYGELWSVVFDAIIQLQLF